jgi:hypothetical protein
VIAQPVQADNGVIYPIDAVLVPQKILSLLEDQQGQSQQGQTQGQTKPKQAKSG